MLTYRVLGFLRHQGIFIGMLFGVAFTSAIITGVTILTFYKPRIEVRPQIQERIVVVTSTPAPATSVKAVPIDARSLPPTAVRATPAPTAVPTAVPSPPTAIPTFPPPPLTPAGSVLRFGEIWRGQGMTLTAVTEVSDKGNCVTPCAGVEFEVQNLSGSTLNFEASPGAFYLVLSTGERIPAFSDVSFNSFGSGATKRFYVLFGRWLSDFKAAIRPRNVQHYTLVVQRFNDRIPEAKWRQEITH